jgi:hypothetical protein
MEVHPWPSLTIQDHPLEHQRHSLTGPCFPGDNSRPQMKRCQPCSRYSGRWQMYAQQKLKELPNSPLRRSLFHVVFLLILVSSLPGHPQALDCDSCMHTTQAGSTVTKTLLFLTYYSCVGTIVGSCIHNHTIYSVCSHYGQYICFTPSITLGSTG